MLERFGFFPKKGKKNHVRVLGGGDDERDIASLPYNWLFIVGEFHSIEGCYQIRHFRKNIICT